MYLACCTIQANKDLIDIGNATILALNQFNNLAFKFADSSNLKLCAQFGRQIIEIADSLPEIRWQRIIHTLLLVAEARSRNSPRSNPRIYPRPKQICSCFVLICVFSCGKHSENIWPFE